MEETFPVGAILIPDKDIKQAEDAIEELLKQNETQSNK